jgi:hypothetical protein
LAHVHRVTDERRSFDASVIASFCTVSERRTKKRAVTSGKTMLGMVAENDIKAATKLV